MEQGTTTGTISDVDGAFSLSVSDAATTLVISSVGYGSQEVDITNRSTIDVSLSEVASILDELVVTGYGTAQRREVTSAISSVSEDEFNKGSVSDPMQLLQGKVPGLTVSRVNNDPNKPFFLNIRGVSTLGANSQPLIVLDGVIGANLNNVDPNDIKTVDVLKDASAAAIYGTRGSSGVIIITTKTGGEGEGARIDYNTYVALENAHTDGQGRIRWATADEFTAAGGIDYGGDTDWLDAIFDQGTSHVHNLSISNNTGSTSYRASLNWRDLEGTLRDLGSEQISGRINLTQKLLDDRLTVRALASYSKRDQNFSNPDAVQRAGQYSPSAPIYINNDPSQGFFENFVEQNYNPVAMIDQIPHIGRTKDFLGNFKLDYEVIDGLTLGANYGVRAESELAASYVSSNARAAFNQVGGQAERIARDLEDQVFDFTATYTRTSGDLTYTLLAGHSYQKIETDIFRVSNSNFITDELTFNNIGLGNGFSDPTGTRSTSSNREERLLSSFFGRANVSIKDIYHLTASYRREGSSAFGANNRWGSFFAIGGAADITALTEINFLDNLKLRVGYGETGNLPAQNYAYLTTLGLGGSGYVDGRFVPAIQPTSNPNPDLKWEEKKELNVGVDFALLNFRLSGSLDFFQRNTEDLLNTISVASPPNLFGSSLVNLGELESKGVELQLNFSAINKADFSWDITTNISRNKTKLIKFNNDENVTLLRGANFTINGSFAARVEEGKEIGQIIAPIWQGFDETGDNLYIQPDGSIGDQLPVSDAYPVVGNGQPDLYLGVTNSFTWKNFDLNIFFRGVFGHDLGNGHRGHFEHPVRVGSSNFVITDKWLPDERANLSWDDRYVEGASFVKLDNATLGYSFDFPKASSFRTLRIYTSVQTPFTITSYAGWDPEPRYTFGGTGLGRVPLAGGSFGLGGTNTGTHQQWTGDILAPGLDNFRGDFTTTATIWTFGVNIGL